MSRKLIFGAVLPNRLAVLTPIGYVNGEPIFPHRGADNAGDGGDGESDQDTDDEDGSDDDDSEGEKEGKPAAKGNQSNRNSSVLRQIRRDLRTAKRENEQLKAAQRAAELKDKTEVERTAAERDDAVAKLKNLEPELNSLRTKLAVITVSAQKKYDWADIEDVLNDRQMQGLEIDDDGEVSGIEEALKDLAKRKPHFLKKPAANNGGNGSDGDGTRRTGANFNAGANNNDRGADRARLEGKYGVLRHMSQGAT